MKKVASFIRVNKNNEEYTNAQAVGIAKYLKENNLQLEKNIEVEVSIPDEEKNIFQILEKCQDGCTVVVYNINVFGRTTATILSNIKYLLSHGVRIISVSQNLDFVSNNDMLTKMILGVIGMTINLEKDLMSLRTKEALTAKKLDGISLGKPKGTIQKSKFDLQKDKIVELLAVGLSVRKIAKVLG
ncbi:MAG: recombinase family protein, partial [Arcobacteraceae bacterium]